MSGGWYGGSSTQLSKYRINRPHTVTGSGYGQLRREPSPIADNAAYLHRTTA